MADCSRRVLARTLAGALLGAVACAGETTAPTPDPDDAAVRAAEAFTQLADSVARAGGDADVGDAYAALADVVRRGGRVTPVVMTVDGVPTTFTATTVIAELERTPCTGAACDAETATVVRSLIAWDPGDHRRVVQLTSTADSEPIGAVLDPALLAQHASMASLIYLDGRGGTFFGTSGAQRFVVGGEQGLPCAEPVVADSTAGHSAAMCTRAEVVAAFDGRLEPSRFLVTSNTATGTHTIGMSPQTVLGSHRRHVPPLPCDGMCEEPSAPRDSAGTGPIPPIVVRPSAELPATLTVRRDTVVTLTLAVRNPSASGIAVDLGGPRADFVVTDSASGKEIWRWSAGRAYTIELRPRVEVAGNATLTFSASWRPPARGSYLARGFITSVTHRAEAYAPVLVP